jgi:hypothetical protein
MSEVSITGSIDFEDPDSPCEERPVATVHFRIPSFAVSGLKLHQLSQNATLPYKMFKGLKTMTVAGNYEIRFA